eukprot:3561312-Amphidinium_carterae.1
MAVCCNTSKSSADEANHVNVQWCRLNRFGSTPFPHGMDAGFVPSRSSKILVALTKEAARRLPGVYSCDGNDYNCNSNKIKIVT